MIRRTTIHAREKIEPARWNQLKDILADALELPSAGERTALLETRCAQDAALRAEAESLVREAEALAEEGADSFEACAEQATRSLWQEETSRRGWRLGAYEVVRELGRGGMGAVYLAARADGQYEKEVAIKVLKRGTDTDEVLRRFAAERHILARLEHANIAHLLDAGTTDDGLPYVVMEYVDGLPVTRFVREQNLSIEERLAVFLKICAAVELAHHNHVIHRDLKPSNILVNAEGEPKLLDFGIAKLLTPGAEDAERTAPSEQRLTPICASPEQTDGRPVTEASDVYALGALLYELLSGQQPHKFASPNPSREEICRVVREQDPLPPSACAQVPQTARRLRGDLDAIVLHALRKEPKQRYQRVVHLAADIRRYLAGEPVLVRRPTLVDRARHLVPRRNARVVVGGLVLLAMAGALWVLWSRLQTSPPEAANTQNGAAVVATPDSRKSIAVLPFETLGDNNPPSYFADGVQDNILTDLGRVRELKVISRSGVAAYRGKTRNMKQIGRELGVANVLEGSVQVSGDRVRINAQLIDTQTDTQIWAEQYDRRVEDIFALQSELAQTIATQLKATLSSGEQAELWKKPTQDLVAYDLYLRARAAVNDPLQRASKNWEEAVQLLTTATARDPKFTLAYCLLNEAHVYLYRFGEEHSPKNLAAAKEAAETALRLEPDREEARLALARYYYHGLSDYRRTEEELSRIPNSQPHEVEFFTLASLAERRLGQWKEAIRDGEKAVELDPQDPALAVNLVQTYSGLRRYADSVRVVDAAIRRLGPEAATPRLWMVKSEAASAVGDLEGAGAALDSIRSKNNMDGQFARLWLGVLKRDHAMVESVAATAGEELKKMAGFWIGLGVKAQAQGKAEEAKQAYTEAKRLAEAELVRRPDYPDSLGDLALAEACLGEKEPALQHARRAVELQPPSVDALNGPRFETRLAEVVLMTNDREGTLELLTRLVKTPFALSHGDLKFNPVWDSLRDDPRFEELLTEATKPLPIDG